MNRTLTPPAVPSRSEHLTTAATLGRRVALGLAMALTPSVALTSAPAPAQASVSATATADRPWRAFTLPAGELTLYATAAGGLRVTLRASGSDDSPLDAVFDARQPCRFGALLGPGDNVLSLATQVTGGEGDASWELLSLSTAPDTFGEELLRLALPSEPAGTPAAAERDDLTPRAVWPLVSGSVVTVDAGADGLSTMIHDDVVPHAQCWAETRLGAPVSALGGLLLVASCDDQLVRFAPDTGAKDLVSVADRAVAPMVPIRPSGPDGDATAAWVLSLDGTLQRVAPSGPAVPVVHATGHTVTGPSPVVTPTPGLAWGDALGRLHRIDADGHALWGRLPAPVVAPPIVAYVADRSHAQLVLQTKDGRLWHASHASASANVQVVTTVPALVTPPTLVQDGANAPLRLLAATASEGLELELRLDGLEGPPSRPLAAGIGTTPDGTPWPAVVAAGVARRADGPAAPATSFYEPSASPVVDDPAPVEDGTDGPTGSESPSGEGSGCAGGSTQPGGPLGGLLVALGAVALVRRRASYHRP